MSKRTVALLNGEESYKVLTNAGSPLFKVIELEEGETVSVVSCEYKLYGTITFKLQFRYHNGAGWLGWNDLEENDTRDNPEQFSGVDTNTGYCAFNMALQTFNMPDMSKVQLQIAWLSGTDNIKIKNAFAVLKQE